MVDTETISSYLARLTGYQTELASTVQGKRLYLLPVLKRKAMNDEDLVAHLLTFLIPKYHNIRRFIWDRPIENQTIVRDTLLEHEAQVSLDALVVETTALQVTSSVKKGPHHQAHRKRPNT